MKAIKLAILVGSGLLVLPFLLGFSINGAAPGSSASMTAVAIGTSTPVAVATCSTNTTCRRKAIEFDNITSSGYCYGAPAPAASPCGVASPAPNAGTKAGKPLAAGQSWTYRADTSINGSDPAVCAEWDWVCDTASSSITHEDLP